MNKKQHERWLAKHGVSRAIIRSKCKKYGSPIPFPDLSTGTRYTSDKIPSNGQKDPDISKAKFSQKNYALVPAYNKGPVMVMNKGNIKDAGKK